MTGQAAHDIKSVAADSTTARYGGVFAFTPHQLATLHNPKNAAAFLEIGGLEGLITGLLSDRENGLGYNDAEKPGPSAVLPGSSFSRTLTSASRKTIAGTGVGLARERRAVFGDNSLPPKAQPSFLSMVWGAYNDPVLFLLTAAAVVSLAIGLYQTFTLTHTAANPPVEWVEGVAIITAVVIIVLVSSINDWEKSRQFQKLDKKQLERDAKVTRGGVSMLIAGADILVGDVVHLEPGDVIPADGVLISGYRVMCDESSATGESELVHKTPGDEAMAAMSQSAAGSASDMHQMHFDPFILAGTKVLEGMGAFLVTATGVRSTYGKILASVREKSESVPTPLQERLAVLAKYIARVGGIVSLFLFLALFIRFLAQIPHDTRSPTDKGKNFVDILIISLTVLVIAVPEGLPLAVTLSLAFATTRMLKDNNLVRQLKACETMGNATNICSDKTGTLTQNKMVVVTGTAGPSFRFHDEAVIPLEPPDASILSPQTFSLGLSQDARAILRQSIALNTTAFEGEGGAGFVGSNTESALLSFAKVYLGMGPVKMERSAARIVQLIPFNAARQCMATVIALPGSPGSYRAFIKGAAETLLSKSTGIIQDPTATASVVDLDSGDRQRIAEIIESYAGQALRTIGLVYRDVKLESPPAAGNSTTDFDLDYLLRDLVLLGVVGIHDPLRPGVSESVQSCQRAGVTVRMVTGDSLLTAKTIAKQCGILSDDNTDLAMEGADFRALDDSEMARVVPYLKVVARSSPEDKQRLVVALKSMGEVVAVTGDGTNDASAMHSADVSFAMGATGTEVAREASSIVLMTDDFTCIVKAIMWGRAVNDSVKKFLQVSRACSEPALHEGDILTEGFLVPNHHHHHLGLARLCVCHHGL